jgi:hypothetical protein
VLQKKKKRGREGGRKEGRRIRKDRRRKLQRCL